MGIRAFDNHVTSVAWSPEADVVLSALPARLEVPEPVRSMGTRTIPASVIAVSGVALTARVWLVIVLVTA